ATTEGLQSSGGRSAAYGRTRGSRALAAATPRPSDRGASCPGRAHRAVALLCSDAERAPARNSRHFATPPFQNRNRRADRDYLSVNLCSCVLVPSAIKIHSSYSLA